jgi:hypothetical protein
MEMESGDEGSSPVHLKNSPFGIQQMEMIEKVINGVVLPS